MPDEGSVFTDESGGPTRDSELPEDQEVETSTSDEQVEPEEKPSEETQETELTEKGTKLDPNPLSAAHQQLANERKIRQQYEQVLTDPELLKRYATQAGLTFAEAKAEVKEAQNQAVEEYTADKFQNAEDLAKAFNEMRTGFSTQSKTYEEKIAALEGQLSGLSSSRRIEQVANQLSSDVLTVREKYPELDPKSSDFDKELEKDISELYHELDFDPRTNAYRGGYSLAKLADKIMSAAGKARQKGAERAQTVVREKVAGRVMTSGKATAKTETESTDPSTVIAQRIRNAMGG
jgi:hypothetical protein